MTRAEYERKRRLMRVVYACIRHPFELRDGSYVATLDSVESEAFDMLMRRFLEDFNDVHDFRQLHKFPPFSGQDMKGYFSIKSNIIHVPNSFPHRSKNP